MALPGHPWRSRKQSHNHSPEQEQTGNGEQDAEGAPLKPAHEEQDAQVAEDDAAGPPMDRVVGGNQPDPQARRQGADDGHLPQLARTLQTHQAAQNQQRAAVAQQMPPAPMDQGGSENGPETGYPAAGMDAENRPGSLVRQQAQKGQDKPQDMDNPEQGDKAQGGWQKAPGGQRTLGGAMTHADLIN